MHYWLPNKILFVWLILFLHLNMLVVAQETAFVQLKGKPEFNVSPTGNQAVRLFFLIREGYHIQANQVRDENLIPSALTFETMEGLILGDPVFPEAVEFSMEGTEETMDVFSDTLEVGLPVRILKGAGKGPFLIKGKLHYQACDDTKCFYPRDLEFIMRINME